jgi:cell wall-associated NlpC family hydrolase
LVMRLGTRTPMHGAIYVGDDKILHQRVDSISAVEPLRQYYRKRIAAVFRHATCHAGR